jgi:glycosyltransferase involved in cell wall biosynthesis
MDKILVFIPMYNCEKQIPRVLNKIRNLKEKQKYLFEILIIDNRSKDRSCDAAIQASEGLLINVTVIKNKSNIYLGGSHKVAFNYAIENSFDYLIVLHGDDQGDIRDIILYIEKGEYKKYDSFLGSRFHKNSKLVNYSKFRIFGNRVFNALVSISVKHKIRDIGSGLNMYKVTYLENKFYLPFPNNQNFNIYMLLYSLYSNSPFVFFPLSWREDDQTSNAKLFSQTAEICTLMLRYFFNKKKVFTLFKNKIQTEIYEYDVLFEHKLETNE